MHFSIFQERVTTQCGQVTTNLINKRKFYFCCDKNNTSVVDQTVSICHKHGDSVHASFQKFFTCSLHSILSLPSRRANSV